jgi:aminobenzoyl-glutamate transport protein
MSAAEVTVPPEKGRNASAKMLDVIERLGNKVPHPVMLFLYLIAFIIVLSHIMYLFGVSVTEEIIVPAPQPIGIGEYQVGGTVAPGAVAESPLQASDYITKQETIPIRSLLTVEGLRFIFTSFVNNFAGFSVVAVIFVAMIGVGVAEEAGLMASLIRKLVVIAPATILCFIIVFVGGLSSVATDAGYLILIPLGAVAFLSVGRHPLAGVAAAYAGVSAAFAVNILIAPLDALLTEMTNEAIALATPGQSITITANYFFSFVFTIVMAIVITIVTERMIEPRLGKYQPEAATVDDAGAAANAAPAKAEVSPEADARGLKFALYGFLAAVAFFALMTAPPGAPLRDPQTGAIIGNTPFMDSLIFIITITFLLAGIGYGIGAKTMRSSNDVVGAVAKTFAGQGGLVLVLLTISQFIAYFNYSNMPRVLAVNLANILETANIGAIPLLVGFILVIMLLDIVIPGSLPKWAIFAPIFVPLFIQLGVPPQTVLAAYRVGDSPINVITPLMVYLPFIVIVSQRYVKSTGLGTIIALMLPYTLVVTVVWILLFIVWFALGIPVGPGYPVRM